jgi:hypothetical protein
MQKVEELLFFGIHRCAVGGAGSSGARALAACGKHETEDAERHSGEQK